MVYQRTGSALLRVGILACLRSRLTMVLNRTRTLMHSSSPFLVEALPLGLSLQDGGAVPLLPLMVHRGTHPLDLAGAEGEEAEAAAAAAVDGAHGLGHQRLQQPHGAREGAVAVAGVPLLGLSRLPHLLLSILVVVPHPQ